MRHPRNWYQGFGNLLRSLLHQGKEEEGPEEDRDTFDLNSIAYNYNIDVTNNIFSDWRRGYEDNDGAAVSLNGITQMYISSLQTVEDFGQYAQFVNLFTNFITQKNSF